MIRKPIDVDWVQGVNTGHDEASADENGRASVQPKNVGHDSPDWTCPSGLCVTRRVRGKRIDDALDELGKSTIKTTV